MKKIGFIGAGNMAGTILDAVLKAGVFRPEDVALCEINPKIIEKYASLGVTMAKDYRELSGECEMILLGVKPQILSVIYPEIAAAITEKNTIVSIAAGWTAARLRKAFGEKTKILRVMPNMPALAGEGMTVLSKDNNLDESQLKLVVNMFEAVGKVMLLEEKHMDTVTALTGSGPATVFMLIDALADAAVLRGIPKAAAITMAAQMVKGSAAAVLASEDAPSVLKDKVCSPGGTTIEGVYALQKDGFAATVMNSVLVTAEKSEKMSQ